MRIPYHTCVLQHRLALSKSDVAVADPLESTLGDKVLGCSFLIVAQKALGSLVLLANLMKKFVLGLVDSINNGIAKISIFDKPVMAFRMFESMVEGSTFLDGRSDFMVNPSSVGFDRYSFTRDTAMHGTHKNLGPFSRVFINIIRRTDQRKVLQQPLPQLDVGSLVNPYTFGWLFGRSRAKGKHDTHREGIVITICNWWQNIAKDKRLGG